MKAINKVSFFSNHFFKSCIFICLGLVIALSSLNSYAESKVMKTESGLRYIDEKVGDGVEARVRVEHRRGMWRRLHPSRLP